MTWKVINISDTGTASKFGGNDLDKVSQLLSGTDVNDVLIDGDWTFESTSRVKADNYLDIKAISEPASPASGYIRLFIDSADGVIKIKKSNGDVVSVE